MSQNFSSKDAQIIQLMEESLALREKLLASKKAAYSFSIQIHNGLKRKNAKPVQIIFRSFASKAAQSIAEESLDEMKAEVLESEIDFNTAKKALIDFKKSSKAIEDPSTS